MTCENSALKCVKNVLYSVSNNVQTQRNLWVCSSLRCVPCSFLSLWPSKCCSRRLEISALAWNAAPSPPSPKVCNLDSTLSFQTHLKSITKSTLYHLLARDPVAEALVHSFITSHLDYCIGVLFRVPIGQVQNWAATLTRPWQHITPILNQLHWLPIKTHIPNKTLLLTYRSLHGPPPSTFRTYSTRLSGPRGYGPQTRLPPHPGCKPLETEPYVLQPPLWNSETNLWNQDIIDIVIIKWMAVSIYFELYHTETLITETEKSICGSRLSVHCRLLVSVVLLSPCTLKLAVSGVVSPLLPQC